LENNSFCKISSKCKPNVNIITKKKSTKKSTKTKTVKKSTNKKTSKKSNNKKTTTTVTTPPTPVPHQTDERGNFICNGCIVTATGGDNSLWGWEEEKSCIISLTNCKGKLKEERKEDSKNSKANANFKKDAANNYICNGCEVTAVGTDNAYWGYENETSCIIDNTKCKLTPPEIHKTTTPLQRAPDGFLICNTCEYEEIDQGNGTYNNENGEICRVLGSRCGVNISEYPWCSGCYVTSTGRDGALYGWENANSCVINEITCGLVEDKSALYIKVKSAASPKQYINYIFVIVSIIITLFYL